LEYIENEFKYIDSYLGGNNFAGEEGLRESNIPFWSMNYIGRIVGAGFSSDFLREANCDI